MQEEAFRNLGVALPDADVELDNPYAAEAEASKAAQAQTAEEQRAAELMERIATGIYEVL